MRFKSSRAEALSFITRDIKDKGSYKVEKKWIMNLLDQSMRAKAFDKVLVMLFENCPDSDVRKHRVMMPHSNPNEAFSPNMKGLC